MWTKQTKSNGENQRFIKRFGFYLFLTWSVVILISAFWVMKASAQEEGSQCPPGFVFDRLSGVGCVQEDCFSVGYYSYTGTCICQEGYSGCYEPIDNDGFDSTLCSPFCPNSVLVACIQTPGVCPSEAGNVSQSDESGEGIYLPTSPDSTIGRQIEQFISGPTTLPPTPMRAVTGAMTATMLLGSWLAVDWLRDKELLADIWKDVKEFGKSLLKPITKDVKRQVARKVGSDLAVNTADILDSWDDRLKAASEESKNVEKTEKAQTDKIQKAEQEATDLLAEEFLKGGKTDIGKSTKKTSAIPQAKASIPVTSKVINPKSRVFDGSDAMIILKELGMLPQDTAKDEKISITRDELDDFIGPALDNRPRKITLPSGRTIIVTKVEAILFEGEDEAVPGKGPKQIDFKKSVVITAELVEEAPTKGAPAGQPAGGQVAGKPAGIPAPPSQQTIGQQPGQPTPTKPTGWQPPGEHPAPPTSGTVSPSSGGKGGQPGPPGDSPGIQDQSTFPPDDVTYTNPWTGEKLVTDRQTKALLEEADRILRGEYDDQGPPPDRAPSEPGQADLIDGDEGSSATEDF